MVPVHVYIGNCLKKVQGPNVLSLLKGFKMFYAYNYIITVSKKVANEVLATLVLEPINIHYQVRMFFRVP